MEPNPREARRQKTLRVLEVISLLCGLSALAVLVLLVGWPWAESGQSRLRSSCTFILAVFVVQEGIRLALQTDRWRYLRGRYLEVALAFLVTIELFAGRTFVDWLGEQLTGLPGSNLTLFYLAGTQLTLVCLIGLRAIRDTRFFAGRKLAPGMVFMVSFALVILVGTLLLKTPQAGTSAGLPWVDAVFTATSAVCVSGLLTVDLPTTFSRHGQWIILGLIQVGGLGVMTLTCFFAHFFAGGVSLRSRIAMQDLLSEENLGQIGTLLGVIVGFTLLMELGGAFLIHLSLQSSGLPADDLVFFSLFHSVSAFCNAGYSTLSAGLSDARVSDRTGFISVVMVLIVIGGIGFPVLKNFWLTLMAHLGRMLHLRVAMPPRLSANSQIVLLTTAALIVGGTFAIWLTEFAVGYGERVGPSWYTALFHSIAARTAGFNLTSTERLMPATAAILMALMFVGGSPASTAGGIKVSTLAIAVLSLRRILSGRTDLEAFGRRLDPRIADRALAIIILSMTFITLVAVILIALHPELPPFDLAFEAVGAVSTAGMTRGITTQLGVHAKIVLIVAMFVGRIGVLLCVLSLIPRRKSPGYRLPETTIVLG